MAGEPQDPARSRSENAEIEGTGSEFIEYLYDELCMLAKSKLYRETSFELEESEALVDEVWLRLGGENQPEWANRAEFFAAAAKAMRRILIESARHRKALRHGGNFLLVNLSSGIEGVPDPASASSTRDLLLSLNEALSDLAITHPQSAKVIQLHYFWGLTVREAAHEMGISLRTAHRRLEFGRQWLRSKLRKSY